MIFKLVDENDPILHNKAEDWDFEKYQTIDLKNLIERMVDTMIHYKGVGLAAPQCGVGLRIFIAGNPFEKESIRAFINPKIVHETENKSLLEEGCLSYPDMFIKIKRPAEIRVRYFNMDGEVVAEKFSGVTSHVVQHEYDHLDGIVFHDRAVKLHLDQAKRKYKSLTRRKKRL